jgi:hypothetical protein
MKKLLSATALCLITVALISTSCKKDDSTPATPSLYDRVGGTTLVQDPKAAAGTMIETGRLTLRAVVDSSINVIAADASLAHYFPTLFAELASSNTTGLTALSKNLTDFLCSATGSKNTAYAYTGLDMTSAHNHATNPRFGTSATDDAKATSADFDEFIGDIGVGLGQNGVTSTNSSTKQLYSDLVALLNTLKPSVAQR